EQQVLESLPKAAGQSQHTFILFSHTPPVNSVAQQHAFERPPSRKLGLRPIQTVANLLQRGSRYVFHRGRPRPLKYSRIPLTYAQIATDFLIERDIDVMFYPSFLCLSREIPYL